MKKRKLKIGIVGCGAIGTSLAKAILRDLKEEAELSALYDLQSGKSLRLSRLLIKSKKLSCTGLGPLIKKSDLVIEAASGKSSWDIAKQVLSAGRDMMLMSIGGIVAHIEKLRNLAKKNNCRVYLPSGAIAGIDALKATAQGKISRVTLTTTKNPASFSGVGRIAKDKVLFSGSAEKAVKLFPQNINVAGLLSIAGIGAQNTKVKIIASPKVKKNNHEIEIESQAARIFTRTENLLHPDNPKTSFLAVLSAIATLKQIFEPIKIGT